MLYISVSFPDDKASRIASLCTWRRFSRSSSARRSSSVLHHELPPVRSWPDASYRSQRLLPLHWWRSRLVNVVAVLLEATASSVSPTTIARFLRQRWQVMRANCWRGMATSTGHLPPAGLRKKNDEENVDHKLDSPVEFSPLRISCAPAVSGKLRLAHILRGPGLRHRSMVLLVRDRGAVRSPQGHGVAATQEVVPVCTVPAAP